MKGPPWGFSDGVGIKLSRGEEQGKFLSKNSFI